MGGDSPHLVYGSQVDYKKLYFSEPLAALKVPISVQAGYGKLDQGRALAKNISAAGGIGKLLPYNATTFNDGAAHEGRAFLVADSGTGGAFVYVNNTDGFKFGVGDDLIVNSTGQTAEDLGAITAVDRTSETHRTKVTATTNITNDMTTAHNGYACVEGGDNTNNYSDAVGILEKTVDTGNDANAAGAVATLILGNCVLYTGMLTDLDAAAATDISSATFGNYTYIR